MRSDLSCFHYSDGLRDGFPIGLGYLSVALGFGISAVGQGLRALETMFISMTNFTSAGQIAGVSIIAAGGTALEMILTQIIVNLRYSLMGISMTQKLDAKCTTWRRLLLSWAVTDELFAVVYTKPGKVGPSYLAGLFTAPYLGWILGTVLGAVAGQIMPERLQNAAGLMVYIMFVAILIPPVRREKGVLAVAVLSSALSCVLYFVPVFHFLSSGFSMILCAVIASVILSFLCPVPDEDHEEGDA